MEQITSRQNPLVKRFRALARLHASNGALLLDGEHLVAEALASGVRIEVAAVAGRPADASFLARISESGARLVSVTDQVLRAISPVRSPSGVVAIAHHGAASLEAAIARAPQLILVLAGVQDAGNVGAMVRTAEACGATGVVAAEGTADPFGWKALRGAMGSTFRLPIAVRAPVEPLLALLRGRGIHAVAMVPAGGTPLPDCDLRRPVALLLGTEGSGLPNPVTAHCDERVSVPMRPPVESLNVAAAAAVVLYEASRQRRARARR